MIKKVTVREVSLEEQLCIALQRNHDLIAANQVLAEHYVRANKEYSDFVDEMLDFTGKYLTDEYESVDLCIDKTHHRDVVKLFEAIEVAGKQLKIKHNRAAAAMACRPQSQAFLNLVPVGFPQEAIHATSI